MAHFWLGDSAFRYPVFSVDLVDGKQQCLGWNLDSESFIVLTSALQEVFVTHVPEAWPLV